MERIKMKSTANEEIITNDISEEANLIADKKTIREKLNKYIDKASDNRKKIFIFGIIVLVAFVLALLTKFGGESNQIQTGLNDIVLVRGSGTISYKSSEEDVYEIMEAGEIVLDNPSYIKNATNSFSYIFLPDNSFISVDPNTELVISLTNNDINIELLSGSIWSRIQSSTINVEASSSTITAGKSIFNVYERFSGETFVSVEENNVEAVGCNEETIDIPSGSLAQVDRDSLNCSSAEGKIVEEISITSWYKRQKLLDEIFIDVRSLNLSDSDSFRSEVLSRIDKDEDLDSISKRGFPSTLDLDLTAPDLTITSPKDSDFEIKDPTLEITGRTSSKDAIITINDEEIDSVNGVFTYKIDLSEGLNEIEIKAINPLNNNETTKELKVTRIIEVITVKDVFNLYASTDDNGANLSWDITGFDNSKGYYLILGLNGPEYSANSANSVMLTQDSRNYYWTLTPGSYSFTLCTINDNACSEFSNSVSITIQEANPPTSSPIGNLNF
ncbi:MAG: FecR domain-containing protein [Candidatus Dojkabacteria bacterium]|nr:FecR domain-containing protein [Candidatus Dojkabacteria bacterium]MDQ7021056.1 FecR domain-containing protein [Candidatus Dojkabacteria bacterium]